MFHFDTHNQGGFEICKWKYQIISWDCKNYTNLGKCKTAKYVEICDNCDTWWRQRPLKHSKSRNGLDKILHKLVRPVCIKWSYSIKHGSKCWQLRLQMWNLMTDTVLRLLGSFHRPFPSILVIESLVFVLVGSFMKY